MKELTNGYQQRQALHNTPVIHIGLKNVFLVYVNNQCITARNSFPDVDDLDKIVIHTQKNPGTVGTLDDVLPQDPCPSKSTKGNRMLKAQFGHWRTHNEQTLIHQCGVIFACATMFPISLSWWRTPSLFLVLNGIGICVNAWHFRNKHAIAHQYCQLHWNPAQYPELMDDSGKWFFNTSIAEQTNEWLGGYHSICREMLPAKFVFFPQ